MAEKDIVTAIMKYLKELPGCFRQAWKTYSGAYGTSGIPDIIACIGGKFYAFEVKTDKGKLTRLQEVTLRKITDAGGGAFTVTSVAQVRSILQAEEANRQ